MTVQTLLLGLHEAHLEPLVGDGLLVLPRRDSDVPNPVPVTLRAGVAVGPSLIDADWQAALMHLDRLGWELSEDDDGAWIVEGTDSKGRVVIGLYGREAITSAPSVTECAQASADLRLAAGLGRCQS